MNIQNNTNTPNNGMYNPTTDGMNLKDLMKRNESEETEECDIISHDSRESKHMNKSRMNVSTGYSGVRDIANNVNNSLKALDEIEALKKNRKNVSTDEDDSNEQVVKSKNKFIQDTEIMCTPCMEDTGGMFLLEPLLLVSLYVILSQPFVYHFFSRYISFLEQTDEGIVGINGIIIYGVILTSLFFILRRIIYAKM